MTLMSLATIPRFTTLRWLTCVNSFGELQNQIAAAQQQSINLQVALGFRENALRESIEVVEEVEPEVDAG
jgi:L-amino acid N-acyltransferase YncA